MTNQKSQQGRMQHLQQRMNQARKEFKKNFQKLHQVDASHPHLYHYFKNQVMHQLNNPHHNSKDVHSVANYVTRLPSNNKGKNQKERQKNEVNVSANPIAVRVHIPIYAQHYVHQHNKYTLKSMKSARRIIKYQRAIQRERQREERQQRKAEQEQKRQQRKQQQKHRGQKQEVQHNSGKDYLNKIMGKPSNFKHRHVSNMKSRLDNTHPHKHQLKKPQYTTHKKIQVARNRENPQI